MQCGINKIWFSEWFRLYIGYFQNDIDYIFIFCRMMQTAYSVFSDRCRLHILYFQKYADCPFFFSEWCRQHNAYAIFSEWYGLFMLYFFRMIRTAYPVFAAWCRLHILVVRLQYCRTAIGYPSWKIIYILGLLGLNL